MSDTARPSASARRTAHPALVLTVLATASFIAVLDVWITNVGLPAIGRGVSEPSLTNLSWVLSAYAIVYAALLVPAGRLADRFGRKGGFLLGLGLFVGASLGAGLSTNIWMLVAFRGLQAAGAAALTPTSLGLVLTSAPADRVAKYVKIWITTGALAASAGPVLGGVLILASWRWLFLVNIPIGLAAIAAAARWVPNTKHDQQAATPDLVGGLLLMVAIASLALGLVEGPDWGWDSARVLAAFATTVVATAAFCAQSVRHRAPIIQLSLLRDRVFAFGNVTALLVLGAFSIELLSATLWMQGHWDYSAIRTGLATAPGPAMVPIFAALADALARRSPAHVGRIAAFGILLIGAGALLFAVSIGETPNYATGFLPCWLIVGAGVGLALPTVITSATVDLPAQQTATGSAIVNMSQQIGSVIGVSLLVAVLGTASTAAGLDVFRDVWFVSAGIAAVGLLAALGIAPQRSRTRAAALAPTT